MREKTGWALKNFDELKEFLLDNFSTKRERTISYWKLNRVEDQELTSNIVFNIKLLLKDDKIISDSLSELVYILFTGIKPKECEQCKAYIHKAFIKTGGYSYIETGNKLELFFCGLTCKKDFGYYSKVCLTGAAEGAAKRKIIRDEYKEKHGHDISFSPQANARRDETLLKKYGVTGSSWKNKNVREKGTATLLKKYGTTNPFFATTEGKENWYEGSQKAKLEVTKQKQANTNFHRYGVKSILELDKTRRDLRITKIENIKIRISNNGNVTPKFDFDSEFIGVANQYLWCCNTCSNDFEDDINDGTYPICPVCFPKNTGTSKAEKDIGLFIQSLGIEDLRFNDRGIIPPFELDIYSESHRLAIEYNGIYWHSNIDKNYHLTKTERCEDVGIKLIHIFESEWINNESLVKSKLASLFGTTSHRIFARKCKIKTVDKKEKARFLDKNHLQKNCNSSVNIGLYYLDKLVALMTFGKSRFNKNYEWELLRYCVDQNCAVVGGASKLLKSFERHYFPKSLISFADRRWSQGNMYTKLGFQLKNKSSPNYFYFLPNTNVLESRIKFQKHKLKSLLKIYDETLSEKENMNNNGYRIIYDSGNLVFTKEYVVQIDNLSKDDERKNWLNVEEV